jgi:uncharacterized protein (TIGR02569 family)
VAGWRADTFVTGTPEPRHDEVVSAAVRLHEATAKLERPRFLTQPPGVPWSDVDVFIAADRAAWEDRPLHTLPPGALVSPGGADGQRSVELIAQLAALRRPTRSPSQLVHGDLYGTVLFAGTAAPGITDITPYWRPASWAAGVVVVDALAWGEADDGLVERWAPLPEWPQMLLRALMFVSRSCAHRRAGPPHPLIPLGIRMRGEPREAAPGRPWRARLQPEGSPVAESRGVVLVCPTP